MEDNRRGTWEDVTEGCELKWPIGTRIGKWLELHHGGSARALLGPGAIQSYGGDREYRIIENPGDTHYSCGTFRIEHFIPDPEPVIAYKAVRVDEDGVMRSIMCGSDVTWGPTGGHQLDYEIGQNVDGGKYGIFCFTTLEGAKSAYAMINPLPRSSRPLAILRVGAYGEPVDTSALSGLSARHDLISYPSVKVLSVAWEGEKKEEWVDVTDELRVEMGLEGYVNVWHGGVCVISFGSRLHEDSMGKDKYRVTTTNESFAGRFKVEKRND